MTDSARTLLLAITLLTACNCGSTSTSRVTTPTTTTTSTTATTTTAAPSSASAAGATATSDAPRIVRVTMPSERGTLEYLADLPAGSLTVRVQHTDGSSEPAGDRVGEHFPIEWRETIARLATEARGARCEATEGVAIRIEIDGVAEDVVLPPFPEDRDYFPPEPGEVRACAPHELARTMAIYLSWE